MHGTQSTRSRWKQKQPSTTACEPAPLLGAQTAGDSALHIRRGQDDGRTQPNKLTAAGQDAGPLNLNAFIFMIVTAEIPPLTPQHLAELFWQLSDTQQADFFGHLGACALSTPTPFTKELGSYFGLDMQMFAAMKECTPNGKRVMELIGQMASGERLQPYLETFQSMPRVPVTQGRAE